MVRGDFSSFVSTRMVEMAVFAVAAILVGCGRGESPATEPRVGAKPRPASVSDWTAEQVKSDPVGFALAAIREKESMAARLRDQETKLETARQKAERELAALKKAESEARLFGKAGMAVCRNPESIYPVTVAGRQFHSREALFSELQEANRTCAMCVSNQVILANQAARDKALLSKIRDCLAAIAAERYELERKADAARTAVAEEDLNAIGAIANDLSDSVEAALPSDELFAPPVHALGEAGIDEKLDEFNF